MAGQRKLNGGYGALTRAASRMNDGLVLRITARDVATRSGYCTGWGFPKRALMALGEVEERDSGNAAPPTTSAAAEVRGQYGEVALIAVCIRVGMSCKSSRRRFGMMLARSGFDEAVTTCKN